MIGKQLILFSILFLSACISLGVGGDGQKPLQLYTLTAVQMDDNNSAPAAWPLLVEPVTTDGALNTTRVALKKSPLTVDYFADAHWADEAPKLIQRLLVESFENSKKVPLVSGDSLSIRADYSLKVELRDFQAEYDTAAATSTPTVRVRYSVKLVKMPQRSVLKADTFEAAVPATSNTMADIIQAFDQANNQVAAQTIAWTLATGNALSPPTRRK